MVSISELEKQILKEAYPNLSFTDDLDIERYFELRKAGEENTALFIYNNRLRLRYPDEKKRVQLLSFYRTNDPRFYDLLDENLNYLAKNTIEKIKRVIVYITDKMAGVKLDDVFSLISTVESLVSQIKADRFQIIAECEKYTRFARLLDFKAKSMTDASEIIRMYLTDTISSVNAYRNEKERLRQKELELKKKASIVVLDFSKIQFSEKQIREIVLPNENIQFEDQVLAYIIKYWEKVFDRSFANTILFYSRKYKTRHYDIFNAIKTARIRNWQDSELLQAVLSNVVTGYYYSISGDLYLNRNWQRIKPILINGNKEAFFGKKILLQNAKTYFSKNEVSLKNTKNENKTIELYHKSSFTSDPNKNENHKIKNTLTFKPQEIYVKKHAKKITTSTSRLLISKEQLQLEQKKQDEKYAMLKLEEKKYFSVRPKKFMENAKKQAATEKAFLERQRLEAVKQQSSKQTKLAVNNKKNIKADYSKNLKVTETTNSFKKRTDRKKSDQKTKTSNPKKTYSKKIENVNIFTPIKNNGFDPNHAQSIEQMIKKATGKNYVIHKDLFFKNIRHSIRHILSITNMNKRSIFNTEQNTAENIIYNFLEHNYNNPYQQWESSTSKDRIYELGFNVKTLDQIIKHWLKEIS